LPFPFELVAEAMSNPQHRKMLSAHYSSGGPADIIETKPRHVRAKTRIAGRFEVSDLDHNSASATSPVIPMDVCGTDERKTPCVGDTPVATDKRERVMGRFSVSDLSSSPPKEEIAIKVISQEEKFKLDECSSNDLLTAISRKMAAMESELALLREENSRLRIQVDEQQRTRKSKGPMLRVSSSSCLQSQ